MGDLSLERPNKAERVAQVIINELFFVLIGASCLLSISELSSFSVFHTGH
jgi:hypothetical protein